MISVEQRDKIKEIIGSRYTNKILSFLKTKKIVSHLGTEYKPSTIRAVMNGEYHNLELEVAIYDCVDHVAALKKQAERKRKMILRQQSA